MNARIFFIISLAAFVVILTAITMMFDDSKKTQLTHEQKCADLFDKGMNAWNVHVIDRQQNGINWKPPSNDIIFFQYDIFSDWRKQKCPDTVNDWAYLSENEDFIRNDVNWTKQK